jgi:hypothetical protein
VAVPTYSKLLDTLNTMAREHTEKRLTDNVFNATPMLQELRKRQRTYPGGLLIEEPLEYATNPNIGSYSGTDTFATADHEFATKAQFGMKDLYVSTVLTGDDLDKCSGPDGVLDLARSKMKNAERSLVKEFTRQLFTDGTGNSSKDITGLKAVCDDGKLRAVA